ncbi:alpha/beta hydrolase [Phenylobacterium sp. J367]|nr:alpha/beta hydrolase [Phenylobacterium sp. J367]MCR5877647.1 alpha/beta hydrolase [Phenylobacterium sp. J367]
MSLPSLTHTDFPTGLGTIPLWHRAGALDSAKPVMLTVTGTFAPITTMSKMQQVVGDGTDCFLMHLPGNHSPPLAEATVAAYARALSEVIDREFAARPVVLAGVSIGALVALAVRSAAVRRIVAIEPPLLTAKLWPMLGPLAQKLKAEPDDRGLHDFVEGVFGVTAEGRRDIDYRPLLDGLAVPVDVVIGDRPLMPERKQETYPSFVDQAERDWLAGLPNVELHVAPAAGHNIPVQAPFFLKAILLDALLSVGGTAELTAADRDLLSRAPVAADRVLYVGPAEAAFRTAYLRRNPRARFSSWPTLAEAAAGPYDLVLLSRFTAQDAAGLSDLVADGGAVAAVGEPAALPALDRAPFSLVRLLPPAADGQAFDDRRAEPGAPAWPRVAVARKAAAATPLFVRMASFAPRLMDVRTRLPAQGLRTDPELVAALSGPQFILTDEPVDRPKVLILQRPALLGAEAWRKAVAQSLVNGWVVVMEADDHPELVAEVMGETAAPEAWERFGYVHAVQTSTPQLAEAFGRYNPEVKVFANCAFDLPPIPRKAGAASGVLWRGHPWAVRHPGGGLAGTRRRGPPGGGMAGARRQAGVRGPAGAQQAVRLLRGLRRVPASHGDLRGLALADRGPALSGHQERREVRRGRLAGGGHAGLADHLRRHDPARRERPDRPQCRGLGADARGAPGRRAGPPRHGPPRLDRRP